MSNTANELIHRIYDPRNIAFDDADHLRIQTD